MAGGLRPALAGCDHTHHEEPVVAQRVAGNGGEIVAMAEDAAAVALPAPLAAGQAQVPGGRRGVRAVGEPPQGDVDGRLQDVQGEAIWTQRRRIFPAHFRCVDVTAALRSPRLAAGTHLSWP